MKELTWTQTGLGLFEAPVDAGTYYVYQHLSGYWSASFENEKGSKRICGDKPFAQFTAEQCKYKCLIHYNKLKP